MGRDTLLGAHGWIILVFGLIVSLGIVEVMNGGRRRETSHDHARPKTEPAESIPLEWGAKTWPPKAKIPVHAG